MASLALAPITETNTHLAAFVPRVAHFIQQSRAKNTMRGYKADWRHFSDFAGRNGFAALPAAPETVCAYLTVCADSGLRAGSIQRRVSAIAAMHTAAGFDSPTSAAAVRLCLSGIRRAIGTEQIGKAPVLTSDVAAMLSHVPEGLLGIRNRALVLLGFAGAFRRSELVGLDVEDLTFTEDGVKVRIRRSKTDQEGAGQVIGIVYGSGLCPVRALRQWLETAGITTGPVFRSVHRGGHVQPGRLSDQVVASVVKQLAAAVRLDAKQYAGHSLRAGLVTQAVVNHVDLPAIQRQTRHKSLEMLLRYSRAAKLFTDNASARVGL